MCHDHSVFLRITMKSLARAVRQLDAAHDAQAQDFRSPQPGRKPMRSFAGGFGALCVLRILSMAQCSALEGLSGLC